MAFDYRIQLCLPRCALLLGALQLRTHLRELLFKSGVSVGAAACGCVLFHTNTALHKDFVLFSCNIFYLARHIGNQLRHFRFLGQCVGVDSQRG